MTSLSHPSTRVALLLTTALSTPAVAQDSVYLGALQIDKQGKPAG